jgi:magnesium chelatase family protein
MALTGLAGSLVDVEADIAQGLPSTTIIGLPDTALHEARDRVRARPLPRTGRLALGAPTDPY